MPADDRADRYVVGGMAIILFLMLYAWFAA